MSDTTEQELSVWYLCKNCLTEWEEWRADTNPSACPECETMTVHNLAAALSEEG